MQTIILDPAAANCTVGSLLQRVGSGGAEVRDEQGQVIAYVLAPGNIAAYLYAEAHREADQHGDRIQAASARRGGKTTQQLLETLNSLPMPQVEPQL